jgi:hypothetical protein
MLCQMPEAGLPFSCGGLLTVVVSAPIMLNVHLSSFAGEGGDERHQRCAAAAAGCC